MLALGYGPGSNCLSRGEGNLLLTRTHLLDLPSEKKKSTYDAGSRPTRDNKSPIQFARLADR